MEGLLSPSCNYVEMNSDKNTIEEKKGHILCTHIIVLSCSFIPFRWKLPTSVYEDNEYYSVMKSRADLCTCWNWI